MEANYIPSRLGGYVVRDLISNFTFIENVMSDTFIADPSIWEQVRELTDRIYAERDVVKKLQIRKQRAEVFFAYIRESYSPLRAESLRRGLPSQWCSHPLESAERQFLENLKRATRSAERNYGGGAESRPV